MAANALLDHEPTALQAYQRALMGIRINIFLKTLKSPAMYWPWLRNLAMKSGIKHL